MTWGELKQRIDEELAAQVEDGTKPEDVVVDYLDIAVDEAELVGVYLHKDRSFSAH